MGEWSNLTQREKAEVIKFAINNGVSDINTIRDTFNVYASGNGVENEYREGGSIHIKPSKKGTFTAAATKHGKSVQEFARQVLANKENYSPAMVKKANFARNFGGHKHEDGGSQEIFPWRGTKLTTPIPDFKPMVYTIMSQRPGTDRSLPDLVEAFLHGNRKGNYSGSLNENGDPNFNRDLIGLYLYGNEKGFEPIKREEQAQYKGSHDYTSYLRRYNINPRDVTSFKGDFIVGDSPKVSQEIYDIAKVLGRNKTHAYHNLDDDLLNWSDILLNLDRGYSKEDLWYNLRPGYNIDDARNVKRHYELEGDKPVIQASKLWDFTPNKNMVPSEKAASYLLSRMGTPFILRDREELIPSNSKDLETRILNTSILEDATKRGVMVKEGEEAYSPLYSLPEITVVSTTDPYAIPKRERSFMKIIHPVLNKVPLMGHYVTQRDAGSYPYTDYKTTLDDVLTFSTGGPLYPTPLVRYTNGEVLGHQHGLGDFLKSLFKRNSEPQVEEVEETSQTPAPLDYSELRKRQAYTESGFKNNAKSNAGAIGMFQITPATLTDYNKANGTSYTTTDLFNQTTNTAVRDWYINKLSRRPWVTKGGASDSIQFGKVLAGYNYGGQNTLNALNKAKAAGIDIYNSWGWLDYMPKETQDYVNFILRNQNNSVSRSDSAYRTSSLLNKDTVKLLEE